MRSWMRRGLFACLLWPVSLIFRALAASRRLLYVAGLLSRERLKVPVIVVGNIFVGGTGKTPLVIWLVRHLEQAGRRPGVVSRGYGARAGTVFHVAPDSSPDVAGDEPVLIANAARCPVVVGRDRAAAARALLSTHSEVDVVIMDDGLQHYALERDIEILLFDERGIGNGWLLPAGPLREPASRKSDFVVINASADTTGRPPGVPADAIRMRLEQDRAWRLSDPAQRASLQSFSTNNAQGAPARLAAAAGIGNPARFFAMLRAAGLSFKEMPLPDHHDFSDNPFAGLAADVILITEKDAVKCSRIDALKNDGRLWVVPVNACVDGPLAARILEKLRGRPTA